MICMVLHFNGELCTKTHEWFWDSTELDLIELTQLFLLENSSPAQMIMIGSVTESTSGSMRHFAHGNGLERSMAEKE